MSKENVTEIENSKKQSNFDKDKKFLSQKTIEYLKNTPTPPEIKNTEMQKDISFARGKVMDSLKNSENLKIENIFKTDDIDKALKKLEELRDLKSGITHQRINNDSGTSILIRDARNCKEPPVRSTEAFEMQYLNALKAAVDIAELDKPKNAILAEQLKQKITAFSTVIENNTINNVEPSQKKLSSLVKTEIKEIAKLMEKNGIEDCYKTLNVAKDFQNFNSTQTNIVTISEIKGQTIVEAEVGFRELAPEQKQEYQNIASGKNQPDWFNKLPKWEQKLTEKYAAKIAESKHVIPTQLRQIAGMRNAFEKTTAILENDGVNESKLKILHTSKHAGTLASLNKDKKASTAITLANALQAKMWIGEEKILHCNTLNAGVIGSGDDPKIVSNTEKAMKKIKGRITNTSFNAFRLLGIANNYDGAKSSLEAIAKTNDDLKAHIMPRSKFQRLFGLGTPKNNAETILAKVKEPEKSAYRKAIELKNAVEKADVPFRLFFDKENVNSVISKKLNLLTRTITDNQDLFPKIQREEMLTMCASGKDRTGLAEHDQTAQVVMDELNKKLSVDLTQIINDKLGLDSKQVDRKLTVDSNSAKQMSEAIVDELNKRLAADLTKIIDHKLRQDEKGVDHKLTIDPDKAKQVREAVAAKLKINVKNIDPKLFTEGYNTKEIGELATKYGTKNQDIDPKLFMQGHNAEEVGEILSLRHGVKIQDMDRELIKNGHTAQQAGGINAGGGTIGCFGTKTENKAGIPQDRMKNLESIIEVSASTNRIGGKTRPISQAAREDIEQANQAANQPATSHAKLQKMLQDKKSNIINDIRSGKPPQTPPVEGSGLSNNKSRGVV